MIRSKRRNKWFPLVVIIIASNAMERKGGREPPAGSGNPREGVVQQLKMGIREVLFELGDGSVCSPYIVVNTKHGVIALYVLIGKADLI
ncbi:MAG: hypothetical protein CMP84_13935 [Gammaproteobacteria bacterium]|nr:hypothetical protein [Gammaproteobacteria bacterium]